MKEADRFAKTFVLSIANLHYKLSKAGYSITPQEVVNIILNNGMDVSYEQVEQEYLKRLKENKC